MNKIITLITGAERGMGLVTAKELGKNGQQIIIGWSSAGRPKASLRSSGSTQTSISAT